MKRILIALCLPLLVAACSDKPQTAATPPSDRSPVSGTGVASFTASGWTVGDKASWDGAMRARMQLGQNEYSRAAAAPTVAK